MFVNSYGEGTYKFEYSRYSGSNARTKMNFFTVQADDSGSPAFTKLDLKCEISFSSNLVNLVSIAAADLDDNGYTDDFAVLVNTNIDVRLYFYKLVYDGSSFTLKQLGNSEYKLYTAPEAYQFSPPTEASSQVVAGDFDGDGKLEVAAVYKTMKREKDSESKYASGRLLGNVGIHVFKWDFSKGTFDYKNSTKNYSYHNLDLTSFFGSWSQEWHQEHWSGVAGLKAAAADLDGDGKDEIVTLLIGWYGYDAWDPAWKSWTGRQEKFYMYPYLAVWSCPRGLITPQHDESHVKGKGIAEGPLKTYGANQSSLFGESLWYYTYYYKSDATIQGSGINSSGRLEPRVYGGYTANYFSMSAGPFTGTLGTGKTVDDVVIAWNCGWEQNGATKVYLFKTNVNNGSFSGFSDYSKITEFSESAPSGVSASSTGRVWTGMLAADFAGEGVELDIPVHVRDTGDRSYIAVLNAPPYHVDMVSADGNSLVTAPHNFTYSGGRDGSMKVFYDNTTADEKSKAVTFDLSNSVETIFMVDSDATRQFFAPVKRVSVSYQVSYLSVILGTAILGLMVH